MGSTINTHVSSASKVKLANPSNDVVELVLEAGRNVARDFRTLICLLTRSKVNQATYMPANFDKKSRTTRPLKLKRCQDYTAYSALRIHARDESKARHSPPSKFLFIGGLYLARHLWTLVSQ